MITYKLTATVTHKSWDGPLVHQFYYHGEDLDQVLSQIQTLDFHKYNLKKHGRTAFKDHRGVKHAWKLTKVTSDENVTQGV